MCIRIIQKGCRNTPQEVKVRCLYFHLACQVILLDAKMSKASPHARAIEQECLIIFISHHLEFKICSAVLC